MEKVLHKMSDIIALVFFALLDSVYTSQAKTKSQRKMHLMTTAERKEDVCFA